MKVENMTSDKGNKVANQFIITDYEPSGKVEYFQSYESMIAKRKTSEAGTEVIVLDSTYWDYSRTTSKYRNQFLGMTTPEIKKAIKAGDIRLADLNGGK